MTCPVRQLWKGGPRPARAWRAGARSEPAGTSTPPWPEESKETSGWTMREEGVRDETHVAGRHWKKQMSHIFNGLTTQYDKWSIGLGLGLLFAIWVWILCKWFYPQKGVICFISELHTNISNWGFASDSTEKQQLSTLSNTLDGDYIFIKPDLSMNLSTYFVYPEWALLKVSVAVKLMMHERVPAVCVYVAGLLDGEIAGRETADLRPCRINKCRCVTLSANMGNYFLQLLLTLRYQRAWKLSLSNVCVRQKYHHAYTNTQKPTHTHCTVLEVRSTNRHIRMSLWRALFFSVLHIISLQKSYVSKWQPGI